MGRFRFREIEIAFVHAPSDKYAIRSAIADLKRQYLSRTHAFPRRKTCNYSLPKIQSLDHLDQLYVCEHVSRPIRFAPFRCVQRLYRIAVHDSFAFRQRENGSKPETQMVQSTLRQMLRLPIQEGLQLVPCDLIHKPRIERRHEMSLDSVFLGHTSGGLPLSTPDGKIDSLNEMSERIGFVLPLSRQFVDRLKNFSKLRLRFALAHAGTKAKFLGFGLTVFAPLGVPVLLSVSDSIDPLFEPVPANEFSPADGEVR